MSNGGILAATMTDSEWLTATEAAVRLGVSDRTVRRRVAKGVLEAKREDGRLYVKLARQEAATGPTPPEVDKLLAEVASLAKEVDNLTGERDYLRQALAAALGKIPTIAAHASEAEPRRRWWPWGR